MISQIGDDFIYIALRQLSVHLLRNIRREQPPEFGGIHTPELCARYEFWDRRFVERADRLTTAAREFPEDVSTVFPFSFSGGTIMTSNVFTALTACCCADPLNIPA